MAEIKTAKPRRLWRVVLVVSLALNLLVLGLLAGAALRDGSPRGPRGFDLSLGPIGQALDRSDRRAIAASLRRNPDLRPLRRSEMRPGLDEVDAVLRADALDEARLRQALARPMDRLRNLQDAAVDALVDRIAAMSPTERAALADRIASEVDAMAKRPGQK